MPVLESVGRIGNPSHAGTRINRLVGQTLTSLYGTTGRQAIATIPPRGRPKRSHHLENEPSDTGVRPPGWPAQVAMALGTSH